MRTWRAGHWRALAIGAAAALAVGCSSDSGGDTGGTSATDATDGSTATDQADGTDGTDGTDTTDGTASTDATDGSDTTDGTDGVDGELGPNQLTATRLSELSAPVVHAGALAASGDIVAWCDGEMLRYDDGAAGGETQNTELGQECVAVVLDGTTPIVVTADGKWHRDPAGTITTVDGPVVRRLRITDGMLYGPAGGGNVASAPLDLSAAPSVEDTGEADVRDVVIVDGDWVLALGTGGVKRINPDGITQGSYPTNPGQANAVVLSGTGHLLAAVAGTGLVVLDPSNLAELSTTKARGVSLDIAVGQGAMEGFALVADWRRAQLVDVSRPNEAAAVVREEMRFGTDQSRLVSVAATSNGFVGMGLNHVSRLETEDGAPLPQLYLDRRRRKLEIPEGLGGSAVGVLITNDGAADLTLSNFRSESDRVTVSEFPESISAGGIEFMQVDIDGEDALETTFSFDTDDPDNATVTFDVSVNPELLQVGDEAPDFVVPTTGGAFIQLSRLKGEVVHIKLFNAL